MENTQLSLFGKMFSEHSAVIRDRTSDVCLKNSHKSQGGDVPIPQPSGGKWNHAGEIVGDGFSIAWRILDAQYWGVPQRRKRIYLVADFADERAGGILFERESMSRNTEPGEAQGQAATGNAGRSVDRSGHLAEKFSHEVIPVHDKATRFNGGGPTRNNDGAGNDLGIGKPGSPSPTLSTCDRHAVVYEPKSAMEENWDKSDVKNALRATASKSSHVVVEPAPCAFYLQQDPISGEISPCIGGQGQASVGVFMGGMPNTDGTRLQRPERANLPCITVLNDQGGAVMNISTSITGTLRAQEHGHQPIVVLSTNKEEK